jgi:hypothetical protein
MQFFKNQASSIAGQSGLSAETKLCFGAAGGCLFIGVAGYAINTLTAAETTLSAFLVISAFYLMLGVISLFKTSTVDAATKSTQERRSTISARDEEDELVESAA